MQAPKIDKRTYQDIVAEAETLAQRFSGWQPRPDGQADAGQTLLRLFGHFAELLVERLNKVPEKNFLAFLNLIGTEPQPPLPARVPLTFGLATNSPVDAIVPAGTQVAAPPADGDEEEVVFATERNLVVTRAQLQAAFTFDATRDTYGDRMGPIAGVADVPFPVFSGDEPVEHQLYLAFDQLMDAVGQTAVLTFSTPDTWQWEEWPITWEYWEGTAWQTLTTTAKLVPAEPTNRWEVTLANLPELAPHVVNGVEACWLRASLDGLRLPPTQEGLTPEAVGIGSSGTPTAVVVPLRPFGDMATSTATYWYLNADEVFMWGGAVATLDIVLESKGVPKANANVQLEWSYKTEATKWLPLGISASNAPTVAGGEVDFVDETQAFTQDGQIRFRVPQEWLPQDHRGRRGRWLRVKLAPGSYTTHPVIAALTVGWTWQLPRISYVTLALTAEQEKQDSRDQPTTATFYPELGFHKTTPVDVTMDFYPFGEQPVFNDAFYIACEGALVQPDARVSTTINISLELRNPPGSTPPIPVVSMAGKPKVVWEIFNGNAWEVILTSPEEASPLSFTKDGLNKDIVTLPLLPHMQSTLVAGEEKHWLRIRLVGGDFGKAATYTLIDPNDHKKGYQLTPATYTPPVVKSMTFSVDTPDESETTPESEPEPVTASACWAYNAHTYVDCTAIATKNDNTTFRPFTTMADREPALYLGLDQPLAPRPYAIYLQVEPPQPEEVAAHMLTAKTDEAAPQVVWEYAGKDGWQPLDVVDDTKTFRQRGLLQFIGPEDFQAREHAGEQCYWLRARWQAGDFVFPPQLRRVLLNTTWASQASTSRDEILGSGNGNPDQVFTLAQTPVQPGQHLIVRERTMPSAAEQAALLAQEETDAITVTLDDAGQSEEIWIRWHAVPDLHASGPRDRHYTIDRLRGEVRFGNGQQGMIPPVGQNNIRMAEYRYGGGARGNRATNTIVELKSSVPYIDNVRNHEPSTGGADQESLTRVKARGPARLRHRDRAVTAQDLEDLAYAASPEVARVRAIEPFFNPNQLWVDPTTKSGDTDNHRAVKGGERGLVIVPHSDQPRPTPSLSLLERVRTTLLKQSTPTANLWVAGPEWVQVTVSAQVVPSSLAAADAVVGQATRALNNYLHPLTGGASGDGWPFGGIPRQSALFGLLEALDGIDHVRTLTVTLVPLSYHEDADNLRKWLEQTQRPTISLTEEEQRWQSWSQRAVVFAGPHTIRVMLER